MKYFLQLILVLLVLDGCSNQPSSVKKAETKTVADNPPATTDAAAVKRDSVISEYARFIGGIKPANTAQLSERFVNSAFYKKYMLEMDTNFNKIEKRRLSLMREWANTELKKEHEQPTTLFYPFSGPDILHAMTFYPNATNYVMIAMERPGDIPDFSKMDSAQTAYYLNSVYQSLQDIFDKSYFITHKMMNDLQKVKVNGVQPLACLFLERTGHTVVAVRKNHLNDNGTVSPLAADSAANHYNDFIEIYFRTEGSDTLRKITYFRANLGDQPFEGLPAFKDNKPLQNYIKGLPDFYMYAKSASYLMNYGTFSTIRDLCLSKSKSVLQDDTGIGFKYFDKTKWKMKLYGHYVKPVKDFKWVFDTDLDKAYKADSANVKPLKFSLGYHWGNQNEQNLMKAEKQ